MKTKTAPTPVPEITTENPPAATSEIMFGNTTNQIPGAITAMQLSSITYCSNFAKTLNHYLPGWTLEWTAAHPIQGNLAFIARNGNQYAVAIRGSLLNFSWGAYYNWFHQDLNVFTQVDWTYTQSTIGSPKISKGSSEGLNNLNQLVDSSGQSMMAYLLKNVTSSDHLLITGHSLGANLSTVFAPFVHYQYHVNRKSAPNMAVMTFAAPTAGNGDFVTDYDNLFPNSWRFYNEIDIVPAGANSISSLAGLFPPPAPAAKNVSATLWGETFTLAGAFNKISDLIFASELYNESFYAHTNRNHGSVALNSAKQEFHVTNTDPLVAWFEQAGQQHAHNHYLHWLGGSPLTCIS